jgi:hypothetical protein
VQPFFVKGRQVGSFLLVFLGKDRSRQQHSKQYENNLFQFNPDGVCVCI